MNLKKIAHPVRNNHSRFCSTVGDVFSTAVQNGRQLQEAAVHPRRCQLHLSQQ
jgi:hypothetical protein